jgi:hypothetical protein
MGKGEEMNSVKSSHHQGVLTEEDQMCVLIIGGIETTMCSADKEVM